MTPEPNPETSGSACSYAFDTGSTCGTSNGDRVKRSDTVGNVACNAYDALHQVTVVTDPSGSCASVTPAKYFGYDSMKGRTGTGPQDLPFPCRITCVIANTKDVLE